MCDSAQYHRFRAPFLADTSVCALGEFVRDEFFEDPSLLESVLRTDRK